MRIFLEKFKLPLGIDEGLKIEHKLVKRFTKDEGLFSKRIKINFEYHIIIINNKKIDCKIKIKDQVPVSQHQDIKVELSEPRIKENSPALHKNNEGIIEWNQVIKPAEKSVLELKFTVDYPKDVIVQGID